MGFFNKLAGMAAEAVLGDHMDTDPDAEQYAASRGWGYQHSSVGNLANTVLSNPNGVLDSLKAMSTPAVDGDGPVERSGFGVLSDAWREMQPFKQSNSHGRRVFYTTGPHAFVSGTWCWTERHSDHGSNNEDNNDTYWRCGVTAQRFPGVNVPDIWLERETTASRMLGAVVGDIDTDNIVFNQTWRIRGADRNTLTVILHPRMQEYLLALDAHHVQEVRFYGDTIAIFDGPHRVRPPKNTSPLRISSDGIGLGVNGEALFTTLPDWWPDRAATDYDLTVLPAIRSLIPTHLTPTPVVSPAVEPVRGLPRRPAG